MNSELENVPARSNMCSDFFECFFGVECWFVVVLINVDSFVEGDFLISVFLQALIIIIREKKVSTLASLFCFMECLTCYKVLNLS